MADHATEQPAVSGPAPIVAVVGPTATGKSDLAIDLAVELDGEIINADASQLYRGMDIGTAKLPPDQRCGIPHHQLDVLAVTDEATVGDYQAAARADIATIRSRGKRPIVVGGSGLYVRALLDELEIPPTDPEVRARWEALLETHGVEHLAALLAERDPEAARNIEPRNGRRLVRALEVIELTGRPFSATMPTRTFHEPAVMVGLRMERDVLDERIEARVGRMWAAGFVDEVRGLLPVGLREGRTASRAIGYAQVLRLLDGEISEDQAREETVQTTRRLVRRQETWWRPEPRVHWIDAIDPDERLAQALELL